jgi:hypothetical protein
MDLAHILVDRRRLNVLHGQHYDGLKFAAMLIEYATIGHSSTVGLHVLTNKIYREADISHLNLLLVN